MQPRGEASLPMAAERVAQIRGWGNNCAMSCAAVFLANALTANPCQLTINAQQEATKAFNNYYGTRLTAEQLRSFFLNTATSPLDRQYILGPALRKYIYDKGYQQDGSEISLDSAALICLAQHIGFNVDFYILSKAEGIKPSGTIAGHTLQGNTATLHAFYHNTREGTHFDLLMDTIPEAEAHNLASKSINFKLPIDQGFTDERQIAIRKQLVKEKAEALLAETASINAKGQAGKTALMLAVEFADIDDIRTLLAQGADPNIQDSAGQTALMIAIRQNNADINIIRMLLEHGANAEQTAIDIAEQKNREDLVTLMCSYIGTRPEPMNSGKNLMTY